MFHDRRSLYTIHLQYSTQTSESNPKDYQVYLSGPLLDVEKKKCDCVFTAIKQAKFGQT